jgi:DNA repair protein RadD
LTRAKLTLFPDQQQVKRQAYQSLRGHTSTLLQCPTGFGKSALAVDFCIDAVANKRTVTINVPRKELAKQLAQSLSRYGVEYGFIASGMRPNPFALVQISMSETLARRLDKVHKSDLLITDECHVGGESLTRIVHAWKQAGKKVIGLSATPLRMDGKGMDTWFDDMVCGPQMRWLIDSGRLNDYRVFAPESAHAQAMIAHNAPDDAVQDFEFDNVMFGDTVTHYKQFAMGKRHLSFCRSVKHAEDTAAFFRDQGIPAAAIHGKLSDDEMLRRVKAFARRELLSLSNCQIATFGWDLSQLTGMDATVEAASLLRRTGSLALYMQIVGRILRKSDAPSFLFDHMANVATHGLPCAHREWGLNGRLKGDGEGRERAVPVRQCPIGEGGCGFVHRPAPVCPSCGRVYPVRDLSIEQVDETLMEIDKSAVVDVAKAERQLQGRAQSYEDLLELERRKGHKIGWADNVYSSRKGVKVTREQMRVRRAKWRAELKLTSSMTA